MFAAASTNAAVGWRDYSRSRWQLSEKITTIAGIHVRGVLPILQCGRQELARLGPQGDWLDVGCWRNQTFGGGTFTPTSQLLRRAIPTPGVATILRMRQYARRPLLNEMPSTPLWRPRIRFRAFMREIIVRNVICFI